MSRKYILYIALLLVIILALALASQVSKLQRQIRSSVRIIPGESKSRDAGAQSEIEQNAPTSLLRPEVLVKFRAGVSAAAISQITAHLNDQVQDEIESVPGLTTIHDQDNAEAAAVVAQYQALPEVEYAEPNYEISIDQTSDNADPVQATDPKFTEQWALSRIGIPQAWAITRGSSEIVVAVLDSGVEYTHIDLANNIWTRPENIKPYQDQDLGTVDDVHGYNAITNDGDPMDENGHGTFCAGIIGAECENSVGVCGVNRETQIMPLRFLNAGGFGYLAAAVEAINYAIDRKRAGVNLRVINASWGLAQRSRALEDVIREAQEEGILFVTASGSSNANNDTSPRYPAGYSLGNIISVAATDMNDGLAGFSNYGPKTVQLAAPAKDILTTALGNDYQRHSGTSLAAPVVAGVAALALSAHPDLSMPQLRSLLLASVDKLPGLRGKISTGGRINAARAVGARPR
jgi:subtilisin family serine protease